MNHRDVLNLLADYVEGSLDATQKPDLEAHLSTCEDCRTAVEETRFALQALHAAEDVEPTPWLTARILRATVGERRVVRGRLPLWLQWVLRPQVAYSISMAVFSLSFILYTTNVNLRKLKVQQLNPTTWFERADSRGHLLVARAEKFYYDLRFVYDIQSILRQLRQAPPSQPASPQKQAPAGSSDLQPPGTAQLAWEFSPAQLDDIRKGAPMVGSVSRHGFSRALEFQRSLMQ